MTGKTRRQIVPAAVATTIALAILLALGAWQLQRRTWKAGILAAIDHAEASPPIPLHGTPPPFTRVTATGTLRPGRALYGVDVRDQPDGAARMGAQSIAVMARPGEPDLVVDLGWIPTDRGAAAPAAPTQPVTIVGYTRAPDHSGWLSPADDPAGRRFYALDPAVIGAALGARDVAPFTLVAMGPAATGGPLPAEALPRPPNNHLQYAFTWFGLAATLVGVFLAWARKE